jgi:hypothetical protein
MHNKTSKATAQTTIKGVGIFFCFSFTLGSFGCLAWILFLCWDRRNNQLQATTIDSNNQQPKQQSTTKTTTHTTIKQREGFLFILFITGKLTGGLSFLVVVAVTVVFAALC